MLTPEQIKDIASSIYFRRDSDGELVRNDLGDDMFIAGKSAQGQTDGNIGKHFDAHGITKGTVAENIEILNSILTRGLDPNRVFHTAPWSIPNEDRADVGAALGTSSGEAYSDKEFVLVGDYDKKIKTKNDIKIVAVNVSVYPHIDTFRRAFPNVEFVKMSDMPNRITEIYNSHQRDKKHKYSDGDKKILAMELFGYGRMNVAEQIVSGDLKNGVRKPVATFHTWGVKDTIKVQPKDIERITDILDKFGLEWESQGVGFLGQQVIKINTPPENPTIKWLLSVYETIKNKPHLQSQAIALSKKNSMGE